MDNRPIGVFDSGLGGLTVVKELMRVLPEENIIYFGDTARVPYGSRSRDIVTQYSSQCIRFLVDRNVKMAVIACNTVSAGSFESLSAMFDLPLIGVIQPGALAAVNATQSERIGVIGTSGTIQSRAYPKVIHKLNPRIQVFDKACTLFVPIVEEGWSDTKVAYLTAEQYLKDIKNQDVDTLVLGCTHYPFLANTIATVMGSGVQLIDPAVNTVELVKRALIDTNGLNGGKEEAEILYYVSDFSQSFQETGSRFLGRKIAAECVDVESE
ncbi:MAG TPA: glutamate racemase [Clostridiales bacterium]|nr:glutamate racemase [Clostridiales bacterium]